MYVRNVCSSNIRSRYTSNLLVYLLRILLEQTLVGKKWPEMVVNWPNAKVVSFLNGQSLGLNGVQSFGSNLNFAQRASSAKLKIEPKCAHSKLMSETVKPL